MTWTLVGYLAPWAVTLALAAAAWYYRTKARALENVRGLLRSSEAERTQLTVDLNVERARVKRLLAAVKVRQVIERKRDEKAAAAARGSARDAADFLRDSGAPAPGDSDAGVPAGPSSDPSKPPGN